MSDVLFKYVFATCVICPAFSASVIFERQSLVEMQPAALTDAVDDVASRVVAAMASTATAPKRPLLIERPRECTGRCKASLTIRGPRTVVNVRT
jgi:hypothetical protein